MTEFAIRGEIIKADDSLGLVLGWGIICTEKGVPYFDLQGDHIPEDVMTKAAADFMLHSRTAKEMHSGDAIGSIVFSFPLTKDVCEAYGIACDKTGWLIAMRPTADVYAKFKSGEYRGFSIGGRWTEAEEQADV
jgi:hypothetical protein